MPAGGAFRRQIFGYDTHAVEQSLGGMRQSISWLQSEMHEQRMLVQQMESEIAQVAATASAAEQASSSADSTGEAAAATGTVSGLVVPKDAGLRRRLFPGGYRIARTNEIFVGLTERAESAERSRDEARAACAKLQSQVETQHAELDVWRRRQGTVDAMFAEAKQNAASIEQDARKRAESIEREARQQAAEIIERAERQSSLVMTSVEELSEVSERNRNLESLSRLQSELTAMINESIFRFESRLLGTDTPKADS